MTHSKPLSSDERSALMERVIRYQDGLGNTLLHNAIQNRNFSLVEELILNYNNNIFVKNNFGESPLSMIFDSKHDEKCDIFCRRNDNCDKNFYIHCRKVIFDYIKIQPSLKEKILGFVTKNGNSLLHIAFRSVDEDMIHELLYNYHMDIFVKNNQGISPIDIAFKNTRITNLLLDYIKPNSTG